MPPKLPVPDAEATPTELAALAGLRHVCDDEAGITRHRHGRGWAYRYPNGALVRKETHRQRIEELAIPPAWEDVWICRDDEGHVQATGRDQAGRKQYVYHERWSEMSNRAKFARLAAFGRALPRLRARVREGLRGEADTRDHMCAVLVELLDQTRARVGNEEYVRTNDSYGLTTLRSRHVSVNASRVQLSFPGKGGKEHTIVFDSPRLAPILSACRARRSSRLFLYRNGTGRLEPLEAEHVNDFLREVTGAAFTAKDFRTWKASALVAGLLLAQMGAAEDGSREEREVLARDAVDAAAEALGNTRSVCRTYYVHPAVLEAFEEGRLRELLGGFRPRRRKWLDQDEQVLLRLLRVIG